MHARLRHVHFPAGNTEEPHPRRPLRPPPSATQWKGNFHTTGEHTAPVLAHDGTCSHPMGTASASAPSERPGVVPVQGLDHAAPAGADQRMAHAAGSGGGRQQQAAAAGGTGGRLRRRRAGPSGVAGDGAGIGGPRGGGTGTGGPAGGTGSGQRRRRDGWQRDATGSTSPHFFCLFCILGTTTLTG